MNKQESERETFVKKLQSGKRTIVCVKNLFGHFFSSSQVNNFQYLDLIVKYWSTDDINTEHWTLQSSSIKAFFLGGGGGGKKISFAVYFNV